MNPGGKGVPKNRGWAHPSAKLTEGKVEMIRTYLKSKVRQRWIAKHFKVSQSTISHIATGRKWKHVGEPK